MLLIGSRYVIWFSVVDCKTIEYEVGEWVGHFNPLPSVLGNDIQLQTSAWMKKGAPPQGYTLQVINHDFMVANVTFSKDIPI